MTGKVHLSIQANIAPTLALSNAHKVQINTLSGPHPAGNIDVQIHHIDPINIGEVVWYIHPQDEVIVGKLFDIGIFEATRILAVTSSQVNKPKYYKTIVSASIKNILSEAGLKKDDNRMISGSILSGIQIPEDSSSGFYDSQITVIREGNEYEFMGLLAPGFDRFSVSRTFLS
jgi:Na+-transporting NADH:ubiquinone oxidoreductase subunit A